MNTDPTFTPKPGTVAAFREYMDWVMSRAQAATSLVPPNTSADEKSLESHDPTTNYGAW